LPKYQNVFQLITIVFLQASKPSACLKKPKFTPFSQGDPPCICTATKLVGLALYSPKAQSAVVGVDQESKNPALGHNFGIDNLSSIEFAPKTAKITQTYIQNL
jgi:hypothetical protein